MIVRKNAKSTQQSLVSKFLHYSLPSEEQMKRQTEKKDKSGEPKPLPGPKVRQWSH